MGRDVLCILLTYFWRESNKYTKQKSHNVCTDPHTWIMIWFYPAFWWDARSLNSTDNEPREGDSRGAAGAWNEGTETVTEGMLILPTNTHMHTLTEQRHMLTIAQRHENRHTSWEPLGEEEIQTWHPWCVFDTRRKTLKQFEVIFGNLLGLRTKITKDLICWQWYCQLRQANPQ